MPLVSGQAFVGSRVGSPEPATCTLRWNVTGPRFSLWVSSVDRKSGARFAASAGEMCTTRFGTA